jgi:hypothetical protein
LNTDARSFGVQPARTFPTNIHERPFVIAHEDRIEVPAARRIPADNKIAPLMDPHFLPSA